MSGDLRDIATRRRSSGLYVPPHLANLPEGEPAPDVARDADGRRRVVLTDESRRLFLGLVRALGPRDLGFFLACQKSRLVKRIVRDATTGAEVPAIVTEPIDGACGEIMLREGVGGPDPGFGCKCTRVHFVAADTNAKPV